MLEGGLQLLGGVVYRTTIARLAAPDELHETLPIQTAMLTPG